MGFVRMDSDSIIMLLMVVFWVGKGVLNLIAEVRKRGAQPAAPVDDPWTAAATRLERLGRLVAEFPRRRAELESGVEAIGAQILDEHQRQVERVHGQLRQLRGVGPDDPGRPDVADPAGTGPSSAEFDPARFEALEDAVEDGARIERGARETLGVAERLSELRRAPGYAGLTRAADALLAQLWQPVQDGLGRREISTGLPPPVAVVAPDELREVLQGSQLGGALVVLPVGLARRPWLWASLPFELGGYLLRAVPDLHRELHGALIRPRPGAAEPAEIGRILLVSWLPTLFADQIADLLLGPAYLEALTRMLPKPDGSRREVRIQVGADGVVASAPPAVVRIALLASRHQRGAQGQAVRDIVGAWQGAEGPPRELALTSQRGVIRMPLQAVLDGLTTIAANQAEMSLGALSGARLSALEGLQGSEQVLARTAAARQALSANRAAGIDARTLLAAVTGKGDVPTAGVLTEALELAMGTRKRSIAPSAGRRKRTPGRRALARATVVEAMVLNELLLARRGRS